MFPVTVDYHLYQLCPLAKQQAPRQGALLRFNFDGQYGYTDLHPWPELGDLSLNQQLDLLKEGQNTPQLARCQWFAQKDATARVAKKSLFDGLTIPKSNWLCTDAHLLNRDFLQHIANQGFTHIKLKIGRFQEKEIEILRLINAFPFTLRLDANALFSADTFIEFLKKLGPIIDKIQYVEDPCPYDKSIWTHLQGLVPLAADLYSKQAFNTPQAAAYLIVKPAVMLCPTHASQKVIYTSYLDHPVGQMSAAYVAAQQHNQEICGLMTHFCYENNDFIQALPTNGPQLMPPRGYGLGFDHLLENLSWKTLTH